MRYFASVLKAVRRFLNLGGPILAILSIAIAFNVSLPGQGVSDDEIRYATRPYLPQPENAIRIRSDLVEVPVVVRNSDGAAIRGLTKNDFVVFDQGKKRDISFFAVETAPRVTAKEAAPTLVSGAAPASPEKAPAPAPARKPRYVAFYFDDFNMPPGDTYFSQQAAEKFVRESLEPGDKAGIFTSSTTVSQDFTDDKQKLLNALGQIRQHLKYPAGAMACPDLTTYQAFLIMQHPFAHSDPFDLGMAQAYKCGACAGLPPTACMRIVTQAAEETLSLSEQFSDDTLGIVTDVIHYLARMPGRRMLVLTSSGFMVQTYGPKRYQENVIDSALRADIVINTLDAKGLWASPPGGDPSKWMNRITGGPLGAYQDQLDDITNEINGDPLAAMAEGTGGRFFHNQNDLTLGYRKLVMEPEVSYVLGFEPDKINPNANLHTLKVKLLNRRGLSVAARRGYYPPAQKDVDEAAAISASQQKIDRAVLASDTLSDVSTDVDAQPVQLDDGASGLKVVVHVNARNLPFVGSGDRYQENLVFVAALFDATGHFLVGQEGLMKLSVKDATRRLLSTQGLNANLSLKKIPPGLYRLRSVVQEHVTGRLAATNTSVEIH